MSDPAIKTEVESEISLSDPPRYSIVIFNDDFTPIDFVMAMVIEVIKIPFKDAVFAVSSAQENGKAKVGSFSKEVAESKVAMIHSIARNEGHPLLCDIEPEAPSSSNSSKPKKL